MGRERSMASMAMKWRHHIELLSEGRVDYDGGAKRDMDERKEGKAETSGSAMQCETTSKFSVLTILRMPTMPK